MTIRKLASIQKIDEINPIENANRIEIAKVQGWQVIVKKGEFKVNDKCIFVEIDSVLPETPEFEFLRTKHFRIKSQKMRGILSQGIVFPMSILISKTNCWIEGNYHIGDEVTDLLGITKYEPPISPQLMGMAKGNFPSFIPKTDEERLQSRIKLLDEIRGKQCYITQKEDGTSATFYHNIETSSFGFGDEPEVTELFGVCSRNLELKNEAFPGSDLNTYWKVAIQYDLENKLKQFYRDTGRNIAIQGEITGDGIQNNRLGLPRNKYQLHLFNIFDIDNHKYLDYDEFIRVCTLIGLPHVEVLYVGNFNFTLEELLEMAKGKYSGTDNNREGIVIRPFKEEFSDVLQGRLSFKVLNNDYLEEKGT